MRRRRGSETPSQRHGACAMCVYFAADDSLLPPVARRCTRRAARLAPLRRAQDSRGSRSCTLRRPFPGQINVTSAQMTFLFRADMCVSANSLLCMPMHAYACLHFEGSRDWRTKLSVRRGEGQRRSGCQGISIGQSATITYLYLYLCCVVYRI